MFKCVTRPPSPHEQQLDHLLTELLESDPERVSRSFSDDWVLFMRSVRTHPNNPTGFQHTLYKWTIRCYDATLHYEAAGWPEHTFRTWTLTPAQRERVRAWLKPQVEARERKILHNAILGVNHNLRIEEK